MSTSFCTLKICYCFSLDGLVWHGVEVGCHTSVSRHGVEVGCHTSVSRHGVEVGCHTSVCV